jgi:diguanylate cyclase (GGDEF)-like protein
VSELNLAQCLPLSRVQQAVLLLLVWIIVVVLTTPSQASGLDAEVSGYGEIIDVSKLGAEHRIPVNPTFEFVVDNLGLDIDDLLSQPAQEWLPNTENLTNFGQSVYPYWFRFGLVNLDQASHLVYLRLDYPHMDEVDLYLVHDGQIIQSYRVGDTVPFHRRPVDDRVFLFPLNDLNVPHINVFLRVKSDGPIDVPVDLITQEEFYRLDKWELAWYGAYFGIILMMFLYNFFIFLLVRDVTYIYYLFYVASTAALQFTLTGGSFQYIWPQSVSLNNTMVLVFTALMPLAAVLFVRSFLQLEKNGRRFDVWLGRALVAAFSALFVSAFLMPYMLVLKVAHTLSFFAVCVGFYLGVVNWFRGVKAAKTFAMAWFVYLVFVMVYLLEITGRVQPSLVTGHALEIGSALELALLSLSFGHRVNEEKEMRIHAQEQALHAQSKLNKSLDMLVRQRTEELEAANLQLKELSIKDGLTGLFNRRHFDEMLEVEYQRCFREKNWLCVMMLDVDHFKSLNDTYGHQFGDVCLKHIAQTVSEQIRRPPDVVARFGGEEFVVLLPSADVKGGRVVAEKIREAVQQIVIENNNEKVSLTVSVGGVSVVPDKRDNYLSALKQADENLYAAKDAGRNRVVFC